MTASENLVEGSSALADIAVPIVSIPTPERVSQQNDHIDPSNDERLRLLASEAQGSTPIDGDANHHGLPEGRRFLLDPPSQPQQRDRTQSQSPLRLPIPTITPGQLAFSTMQYLPVPVIVLNNLKTVVLANEAMGRMMGLISETTPQDDATIAIERLRGQTLSQVGIDMLQDGRPVWITWESFLDSLLHDVAVRPPVLETQKAPSSQAGPGDATPTGDTTPNFNSEPHGNSLSTYSQGAVIEVVISRKGMGKTTFDNRYKGKTSEYQAFAKMIVTVWELEDNQTFFTLTFTNTNSFPTSPPSTKKSVAKPSVLEAADKRTIAVSTPSSVASSRDSSSPSFHSPGIVTMSSSPFPPLGPPSLASHSSTPSLLQKLILMKDALLDNTQMPILAMWKDGSVTFPNKAARQLLPTDADLDTCADGLDLVEKWELWDENFTRKLDVCEYPIYVLLRTERPFDSMRIGLLDRDGKKIVHDVLGEAIRDDVTGEFLAAVVTGRDVTVMTEEISQIKERDDERFKLICDTMPQLVWTATPDGLHDFFNTRWYTYTGLTPEECLGMEWQMPFHPDDRPGALARWKRSLETGEPYVMEYRCRSKEGEWRWFLGRALAVRNKDTGDIEKWFGKTN